MEEKFYCNVRLIFWDEESTSFKLSAFGVLSHFYYHNVLAVSSGRRPEGLSTETFIRSRKMLILVSDVVLERNINNNDNLNNNILHKSITRNILLLWVVTL